MKFVWSEPDQFIVGAGGTENHTIERARELKRRGLAVELIIISNKPYSIALTDIPITFLPSATDLSRVDDTIVYIARGHDVPTKRQSYIFLHFPIGTHVDSEQEATFLRACRRSKLITNSVFSRGYWTERLPVDPESIAIVYPFAQSVFGGVKRPTQKDNITRVLYPNRIQAEKGLFVFLEAASYFFGNQKYQFMVLGAGNHTAIGAANENWLQHVPYITYSRPVDNARAMAALYARTDIVVVPSRDDIWKEPFGMTSVEAQAAGCRVIASDSGGLRETDCGLAEFIPAGNAFMLKQRIEEVRLHNPVSTQERLKAKQKYTLNRSVDSFLSTVSPDTTLS